MPSSNMAILHHAPLKVLPEKFAKWEAILEFAKDMLLNGTLQSEIDKLPLLSIEELLHYEAALERAHLVLTFLAHFYVNASKPPSQSLPSCLAIPWQETAVRLGMKPIVSYASTVIFNWALIDESKGMTSENFRCLHTFTGSTDESWFYMIDLKIELIGNEIIEFLEHLFSSFGDPAELSRNLAILSNFVKRITNTLMGVYEHCHPAVFYHKIRPFLSGWFNSQSFPNGLEYESGKFCKFAGASAAQSPTIQILDAILSIKHNEDPLTTYLMDMREYLPAKYRNLILSVESKSPAIREFLLEKAKDAEYSSCIENFNTCVKEMENFRDKHIQIVASYIMSQSSRSAEEAKGTGGTSPMIFLRASRKENSDALITRKEN